MTRNFYTAEEEQFIRDNWQTMTDTEMGRSIKRDPRAIASKRANLGLWRITKRKPDARPLIAELWPTMSAYSISRKIGVSHTTVLALAGEMGFPRRTRSEAMHLSNTTAEVRPDKPRGYSKQELAWAKMHKRVDPQAGLILVMAQDTGAHV